MKKFSSGYLEIVVNVGYRKSSSQTRSPCRSVTSAHGHCESKPLYERGFVVSTVIDTIHLIIKVDAYLL